MDGAPSGARMFLGQQAGVEARAVGDQVGGGPG